MSLPVDQFLTLTLKENRVARAGDVPSPDDMADALVLFNEFLDLLNATDRALYNVDFHTYTMIANHQPHTIGLATNVPAPDFAVTIGRPRSIITGNIIIPGNVRIPCYVADDEEWNSIPAGAAAGQAITITVYTPPVLYYSNGWPLGSIFLWPPPNVAYGLEIQTDTMLAQVALSDTLNLPFGYQAALRLSLAEYITGMWGQPVTPQLAKSARMARAAVWGNNDTIPNVSTRDGGMPNGGRNSRRSNWNYLTGMPT